MSLRPVNPDLVLQELDRRMLGYGNGARLARRLGVEAGRLRAIKSGTEPINQKVAAGLGFELRWVRRAEAGKVEKGERDERDRDRDQDQDQ